MKKRTGILLLVGFCLIIAGGILASAGYFAGGAMPVYFTKGGIKLPQESKLKPYEMSLPDLENIVVENSDFDIDIKQGADYAVTFQPPKGTQFVGISQDKTLNSEDMFTFEDRTLTVSSLGADSGEAAGISFGGFALWDSRPGKIMITVPAGSSIASLKAKNRSQDIRLENIMLSEADIRINYGDLSVENVTADNLSLQVDSGDASIVDTSIQKHLKATLSYGDLSLREVVVSGTLDADLKSGNATFVDTQISDKATVANAYGDIDFEAVVTGGVEIAAKSGEINIVRSVLRGANSITNNYGDIDIEISPAMQDVPSLKEEDFSIDAETSYGEVTLNERTDSSGAGGHIVLARDNASHSLHVRNASGDIRIFFPETIIEGL